MRNKMKYLYIYLSLLFLPAIALAQNELPPEKYSALEGRYFLLGFMQNEIGNIVNGDGFFQQIYISASSRAQVRVSMRGRKPLDLFVSPDDMVEVEIPGEFMMTYSEFADNSSIEVSSDVPITVYGFSSRITTSDAYSAIPVRNWGKEYYVMSYPNDQYFIVDGNDPLDSLFRITPRHSEFMIIASEDDTDVMIRPTAMTYAGKMPGRDYWINLDKGECYLVKSQTTGRGTSDLTGTYIQSDKPVGVLSGHERTAVPQTILPPFDSKDHLIEMLPPVEGWGKEYFTVPFGVNDEGDIFRIVAGSSTTQVKMEDGDKTEYYHLTYPGNYKSTGYINKPSYWSSDKPFQIAQFMAHVGGTKDNILYDPSMVMVMPVEQFVTKIIFQTPGQVFYNQEQFLDHYVYVVAEKDAIPTLTLDGKNVYQIENIYGQKINDMDYHYAVLKVDRGKHILKSETGLFSGVIYGIGSHDSYATVLGAGMKNVENRDTIPPSFSLDSYCGKVSGKIFETNSEINSGIRSVEVIEEETTNFTWTIGYITDSTMSVSFSAEVEDEFKDATIAIEVRDYAGNGKRYAYTFAGIDIEYPKDIFINSISSKDVNCATFFVKNNGDFPVDIENIKTYGDDRVEIETEFDFPVIIPKGDSLEITICAHKTQDTTEVSALLKFFFSCQRQANANIKSKEFKAALEVTGYDFGDVLVGEKVCRKIDILNTGDVPITLTNLNLDRNNDVFSVDTIGVFPVTLQPESVMRLDACFAPLNTLFYDAEGSYINDVGVGNSFTLTGRGVAPSVNSIVVDWMDRRVGTRNDTIIYIKNTGSYSDNIAFVKFIKQDDGFVTDELVQINEMINMGDSISISLSFTPKDTKTYGTIAELALGWILHEPITIELIGNGTTPEIITHDIIFDPIEVFTTKDSLAVIIESDGNQDLYCNLIDISGDIDHFVINDGNQSILNDLKIEPGKNVRIPITYFPKTIDSHEMILTFEHDAAPINELGTSYVRIIGSSFSGDTASLNSSLSIDDHIIACQTGKAYLQIENTGDLDLQIQSLVLRADNVIADWSEILVIPQVIPVDEQRGYEIDVLAKRNQQGTIYIDGIANDTLHIQHQIDVIPEDHQVTINSLENMDVVPGDTISIEVSGLFPSFSEIEVDFELEIEYPSSSLYLTGYNGLYLINSSGDRTIPITLTQENGLIRISSEEKFLIEKDSTEWNLQLSFLVLLGEEQTPELILTINSEDCYTPDNISQKMTITDVCSYNLRLVEMFEQFTASVSPNPAIDEIALEIFLYEKSEITVKLFDKNGKISHICRKLDLKKGLHSLIFEISSLANGVYVLNVNANNANKNIMFIISK
jgi:hypothetical protein